MINFYRALFNAAILGVAAMVVGCGGLDPADVPPRAFLRGNVTFVGGAAAWPDSNVYDVRVVAFEERPLAVDSVLAFILAGKAVISESLPLRVESTGYSIQINDPPRTFTYVVVAMQNGPQLLTDWLMLSVYTPGGDPLQPGTVTIDVGETVNVDFRVDFNDLPPQPFE